MLIKNTDKILVKAAENLNLPVPVVEHVVKHFYGWVRTHLNDLEYPSIALPELGTMYIHASLSKEAYAKDLIAQLRKMPRTTPSRKAKYELVCDVFRSWWTNRHKISAYVERKKTYRPKKYIKDGE